MGLSDIAMFSLAAFSLLLTAVNAQQVVETPDEFYIRPMDWPALCLNGETQSPVDIGTRGARRNALPAENAVKTQMPKVSKPKLINKGSALQV